MCIRIGGIGGCMNFEYFVILSFQVIISNHRRCSLAYSATASYIHCFTVCALVPYPLKVVTHRLWSNFK